MSSKTSSTCTDSIPFPNKGINSTKSLETESYNCKYKPLRSVELLGVLLEIENEQKSPKPVQTCVNSDAILLPDKRINSMKPPEMDTNVCNNNPLKINNLMKVLETKNDEEPSKSVQTHVCLDSVSFPNTRIKSTEPLEMENKVFKYKPLKTDNLIKVLEVENDEKPPEPIKTNVCSDSVSFPNTRITSTKPLEMGSSVYKYKPLKTDDLLKLLESEYDEESPKPVKTDITAYRKPANNDSDSSDDENILDKTITQDDSVINNKELLPGVSWLNNSPERKPLKIITKQVPSTPMTNRFNKLSIRDQTSARKVTRSDSLDRKNEGTPMQTPVGNNNIFKTPVCKNKYIPSSAAQKMLLSENSAIANKCQVSSARKIQLELSTPKQQKMPIQINKNMETPRHSSVLQAAIPRDFNTPRATVSCATKDNKVLQNSTSKSDVVLKEKNMNVISRQNSRELITNNEKVSVCKPMPSKQANNSLEIKQPAKKQLIVEPKQLPCTNSDEIKTSFDDKQQNKQSNSNEIKPIIKQNSNELKPLNKQLSNEKQMPPKQPNIPTSIPSNLLQESTFQQLKVRGKNYIVINKIGEGGSGQVYRCLEQDTLQDRAIKIVNLNVDPTTLNSYVNEVKMLKELQESNRVIRMYDYEQVSQNLFVVMEKGDVDFSVFLRNITNETQIQTHIVVCYWIEMLKCVREIHKKGIIHSDLKPSNFLIVGGKLKLIDFGIASRLTCDQTSVIKNVKVGTLNYISPEALLDSPDSQTDDEPQLRISYKSDVWSLGCILYQMVYKRTPFHHIGNIVAKYAIITDRNHKIEYQQVTGVPLYLIDMIKKCLVYDMKSRPTVDELLNMYFNGNYC